MSIQRVINSKGYVVKQQKEDIYSPSVIHQFIVDSSPVDVVSPSTAAVDSTDDKLLLNVILPLP